MFVGRIVCYFTGTSSPWCSHIPLIMIMRSRDLGKCLEKCCRSRMSRIHSRHPRRRRARPPRRIVERRCLHPAYRHRRTPRGRCVRAEDCERGARVGGVHGMAVAGGGAPARGAAEGCIIGAAENALRPCATCEGVTCAVPRRVAFKFLVCL